MRAGVILAGTCALAVPSAVQAQYAATQDSTLRGLERVYVTFQASGLTITPTAQNEAMEILTLELRKAGIRIVASPSDLDLSRDAILNVGFLGLSRALSTDLALRVDIEQHATLSRTGVRLQMVTWYYEDDRRNIVVDQVLQPMVRQAVNRFLNAWLTANGR